MTRDVPTRWLSVEATRRELEPIAQRRVSEYSRDERKAAFSVLNALELLEREAPHHQLRVPKDWHHSLGDPSALRTRISDARERAVEQARAQAAELARNNEHAQELERDRHRGRGTGEVDSRVIDAFLVREQLQERVLFRVPSSNHKTSLS